MPRMGRHDSPKRQRAGRYAMLAVASVLLGVVTTIAVAWIIARPAHLNSGARTFGGGFSTELLLHTGAGDFLTTRFKRIGGMTCYQISGQSNGADWMATRAPRPEAISAEELPGWVYVPGPNTRLPAEVPSGLMPTNLLSYAFGWPLPAMRGLVVENTKPPVFAGRDLWKLGPAGGWYRGLPLSPVWPGFAINSLLFGAAWLVLLRVAGVPAWRAAAGVLLRKRVRRKAGLCPECGYDLRTGFVSGCPECGWGRSR